jgi:hypothetical protein
MFGLMIDLTYFTIRLDHAEAKISHRLRCCGRPGQAGHDG